MKKVLIASTALVAAGMLTAGAASASEKINLSVGGFSKWWVVGQFQQDAYTKAKTISPTNVDVKGDNEIHFAGSTTLDNGIKVGVKVELEAGGHTDQASDVIDESFAFVETGFGKVMIGTYNNGTYLLHVSAPDAAGNWGEAALLQSGVTIAKPANVKTMMGGSTTAIATDGDAEKITYVAPAFYGLTLGASYVPNALSEDNRGVAAGATSVLTGSDSSAYGVGALYANTFGGVGVKVSGGWVTYQVQNGSTGVAVNNDRNNEYSTGANVSYAGFTVGGSFRKTIVNNVNGHGVVDADVTGGSGNVLNLAQQGGRAWDAGVSYANGPYTVSLAYFNSKVGGDPANVGRDKIEIFQASGKYNLGAGVDVLASVGHANFKDETATASNNNKGWAVMTGLGLTF